VLTISGERKRPAEDGGGAEGKQQAAADGGEKQGVKYLRMERRMGKFMRRFPLPESADLDSIRAAYKDGVLTVTVDKKPPPEPKKPRVVQVTLGEQQGKQGGEATYA
jgi:HSP20 family protein